MKNVHLQHNSIVNIQRTFKQHIGPQDASFRSECSYPPGHSKTMAVLLKQNSLNSIRQSSVKSEHIIFGMAIVYIPLKASGGTRFSSDEVVIEFLCK